MSYPIHSFEISRAALQNIVVFIFIFIFSLRSLVSGGISGMAEKAANFDIFLLGICGQAGKEMESVSVVFLSCFCCVSVVFQSCFSRVSVVFSLVFQSANLLTWNDQFLQVGLEFLENVLVGSVQRHAVQDVFQLLHEDAHAGTLRWKNNTSLSYRVKQKTHSSAWTQRNGKTLLLRSFNTYRMFVKVAREHEAGVFWLWGENSLMKQWRLHLCQMMM